MGAVIIDLLSGIQLGCWASLWVCLYDIFWVLFWLFSVGIFGSGFHCVCAHCWAHLLYIGSGYPIVLCGS